MNPRERERLGERERERERESERERERLGERERETILYEDYCTGEGFGVGPFWDFPNIKTASTEWS